MHVNEDIILTTADNLNTIKNNIIESVENVEGILSSIQNSWSCGAADEYKKNFDDSIKKFKSYHDELNIGIAILKQIIIDLNEIEMKNMSAINGDY